VELLDHLDDVGVCINCGGARARRKCSCALESDERPAQAQRPAEVAQDAGNVEEAAPVLRSKRLRAVPVDDGGRETASLS
jgi:hypothetical protein